MLVGLAIACIGIYAALSVFWTLPTSYLGGAAAAGGLALINSFSNLGGFFGPTIMGRLLKHTGNYAAGLGALAAALVLSAGLVIAIGRTLRQGRA